MEKQPECKKCNDKGIYFQAHVLKCGYVFCDCIKGKQKYEEQTEGEYRDYFPRTIR